MGFFEIVKIDKLVYSSIYSLQVVRLTPSKGGQAPQVNSTAPRRLALSFAEGKKLQLWKAKLYPEADK